MRVTPNLADVLQIRPTLGRMFLRSDTVGTTDPVVLSSHELWQSRFGGLPDVIGHNVRLDQKSRTIVGVLPPGFLFPLERAPSVGTGDSVKAGVKEFIIDLSTWGFDTNGDVCRMYRALHARLSALPGVESVGTISSAPLTGKWTFNEKAQVLG